MQHDGANRQRQALDAAATSGPAYPAKPLLRRTLHPARPAVTRAPIRSPPPPSSTLRTDLPRWLAHTLHALDLDDLPVPAALFHRSFLSSPLLFWLLSLLLYIYCVTQHYNFLRSPSLLAPHPQYAYSYVSLRRNEQCLVESWLAAVALLSCGVGILLLSVSALQTGPHVALGSTASDGGARQQQPPQARAAVAGAVSRELDSDADESTEQHPGNWPCLAMLALVFLFFYMLRHMLTVKWPQYHHGIAWSIFGKR